jgi:hypothetical protein
LHSTAAAWVKGEIPTPPTTANLAPRL